MRRRVSRRPDYLAPWVTPGSTTSGHIRAGSRQPDGDWIAIRANGYRLRKVPCQGGQPIGFLVIAPGFTPQSLKLAYQYKAQTNWDVALVTAEGLKYLADRWAAAEAQKPFPVRLLNYTGVIDRERADVILSLV